MLMRERADQILKGLEIAQHLLGAKQCLIGIEDNKPEAAEAMRHACANSPLSKLVPLKVVVVPTQYPSGDARQLIRLLTGIEVPADKRSTDVGLQCFNVATVLALHRYFDFGEPSISRIVTITGNVQKPANYEVLFGTSVADLVQAGGGALADTDGYIMGGPMMGFNLPSVSVPITKASNCVIASAPNLFPSAPPAMPCIRCARCADVCPVSLQPQELYWFAKSSNLEKARDYNLFDCIECGCCTYACPSNIPLVQYYRFAKSEIIAQDRAKEAADLARERNEFRLMRIDREKQERAEKHAQKAAGAKAEAAKTEATSATEAPEDEAMAAKKAAIAAAIERAKAQKAAAAPQNVVDAIPSVQAEIAEIDARREAAKQSVTDAIATNDAQEEK
jgi:electron transport complex protein RnfC